MKTNLTLGTLCLLFFVAHGRAASPPAWAAVNPSGAPVRIAVAPVTVPRFAHLSWVKAIRTRSGTIVLTYIAGTFHGNHGGGSPAVSRSTDGGATFDAPRVLREFGPGLDYTQSGNLALGAATDGALVLLAMAYDGDKTNHIFGWRSDDDGRTWKPTDTTNLGPNKTGSVFGRILPVEGKGLIALGHYRAGSQPHTQGIWQATSKDEGRTWGEPRLISDVPAVEPVLVQSAGHLVGFFRGATTTLDGRQYVGVSNDLGATWRTELSTLTAEKPDQARLAAPCAVENVNRSGELLVLTTERAKPGNTPGRIWLWRGDATKLSWKREKVLLEFPHIAGDPNTDFGYPWLLHKSGRTWMMFYYHGAGRAVCPIWVTEVEL